MNFGASEVQIELVFSSMMHTVGLGTVAGLFQLWTAGVS